VLQSSFTEYHTGYRAVSARFLERVPFLRNSDGLVFDQETVAQARALGLAIEEVRLPWRYFATASPTGFLESAVYGLRTLGVLVRYRLDELGWRGWWRLAPAWHAPLVRRFHRMAAGHPERPPVGDLFRPAQPDTAASAE
jgi:hypothetical protein